jgi:nucleolar complex protein 3
MMAQEPAVKRRRLSPPEENLPGFTKWNLEQDYENRARKKKKEDKHKRLPIKTAGGEVVEHEAVPEAAKDADDADSFLASDDEADSGIADIKARPEKKILPKLSSKELILQAKEELARLASLLSENPEDHIGMLGDLAEFADSGNATVKKLALATQLAVYKDIIPGYRIRPLSKEDMTAKVGKEVRAQRTFEQGLLNGVKKYVQLLAKLAKGSAARDTSTASLGSVAISCACALLETAPHFNLRNELTAILVTKLSSRSPSTTDQDFTRCLKALEHIFREDDDGHISLEAVSQLTKMMKTKHYHFHETVLNTFLHLRLLNEFSGKASTERVDRHRDEDESSGKKPKAYKKEFRTKREKKVMRERKEVAKEMKEADAAVSYEERDKCQAETLKLVFIAYFRILKARVQHLMGAVLEGLARYAHLINQDFFGDVLEVLKDLIAEAEAETDLPAEELDDSETSADTTRNATRESLLCITTAFALLQGQVDVVKSASSLSLDLTYFITALYKLLLPLSQDAQIELSAKTAQLVDPNGLPTPSADSRINVQTTTVLLLRSLNAVLLPPTSTKSVPPLRVQAFTKQLLSSLLHLPQKSTLACLGVLTQVAKTHTRKVAGLWNTEDRKGDGVFDSLAKLEASNPGAATVWEGELLRVHFDPKVREAVRGVERAVRDVGEGR